MMSRVRPAAVLALMIAASATADEPIAGWDRARWGMSISEIQTAYPAAKPHKRETYDFGGRKYYSDLALSDIHVGGYNLTVQFLMDSSDTLAAVKLEKDFDKNMSGGKIAYETLKELLIQKYGPLLQRNPNPPNTRVHSAVYGTALTRRSDSTTIRHPSSTYVS